MGVPIIRATIPARAVEAAATILADVDDLEPWPLAAGAVVSWRDDGRGGARFCAHLVERDGAPSVFRMARGVDLTTWHTRDTGLTDRDGPVLAGEVLGLHGELVALAHAHGAPGGVRLVGRLAGWLDPAPYRAWFGLGYRFTNVGGRLELVEVRVENGDDLAMRPGFPMPPFGPGLGKMRRSLESSLENGGRG